MDVSRLAMVNGIHTPRGGTLFQTLMEAVIGILDIDMHDALDMVGKRSPLGRNDQHYGDVLASVDETLDVIDKHDRQGFKDEQAASVTRKEVLDSFVLEFQFQRAEVDEKLPKRKRANETTQMLPTMVTQAEARQ